MQTENNLVEIVVTCQTKACYNYAIMIPVLTFPGASVVCGVCDNVIVELVPEPVS